MFRYCPSCASQDISFERGKVFRCPICGFTYYHNTAAATACVIRTIQGIIFLVRGKEPGKGKLDLPGGFVDPGEGVFEGLRREIREELGWDPEPAFTLFASFPNIYLYKSIPYNTCDLFFSLDAPDLGPQDLKMEESEITAIRFIRHEDIDLNEIAFGSARKAVKLYLDTVPALGAWLLMLHCQACSNSAIPREYRDTAEALFPAGGKAEALAFADILGVGADYRARLDILEADTAETEKFFHSFQNNLDLLIRKTWVEKTDEVRKETLLDRIPPFMSLIKNANYTKALREFGEILEELAWLLFGQQSRQTDFIEYALRIDTQMGLFWWYGGQIGHVYTGLTDRSVTKMVLLIGLCYLTDL